jgi:hypothetical protein
MAAPAEPIPAADLVVLLYRADWTRLSLSATVHRHRDVALGGELLRERAARQHRRPPDQPPAWWPSWRRPGSENPEHGGPGHDMGADGEPEEPEEPDGEGSRHLLLAPGGRYRLDAGGGADLTVCDGESRWRISGGVAERDLADGPGLMAEELLLPADLLTRFDFEVTGTSQAGGRAAHRVIASALPFSREFDTDSLLDHVLILVDAELGIVLRYEEVYGGGQLKLAELSDVILDPPQAGDPALFLPPPGTPVTDKPPLFHGNVTLPGPAGQAVRTAAGLVGSVMGFAVRHTGHGPAGRAGDEPWPQTGEPAVADWEPAGDDLVRLLHRTGREPPSLAAEVHQWMSGGAAMAGMARLRSALPPALEGILGPDAVWDAMEASTPEFAHEVSRLRAGPHGRYRTDRIFGEARQPETIACDGEWVWKVYPDRVATGPAQPLPHPYDHLLDLAWLLSGYVLSDGGQTTVDGRPGIVVRADPRHPRSWDRRLRRGGPPLAVLMGRTEVIVDTELGVGLRETIYLDDEPAACFEMRTITAGVPDPAVFAVDVPPGTRIVGTGLVGEMGLTSPVTVATTAARLGLAGAAALTGWLQKRPARNEPPTTDHDPSDHNV